MFDHEQNVLPRKYEFFPLRLASRAEPLKQILWCSKPSSSSHFFWSKNALASAVLMYMLALRKRALGFAVSSVSLRSGTESALADEELLECQYMCDVCGSALLTSR